MGLVSGGGSVLHGTVPQAGRLVAVELGLDEAGARAALTGRRGRGVHSADGTLELGEPDRRRRPGHRLAGMGRQGRRRRGERRRHRILGQRRGPDAVPRAAADRRGHCRCWSARTSRMRPPAGRWACRSAGGPYPPTWSGVADRFPMIAGDSFVVADEAGWPPRSAPTIRAPAAAGAVAGDTRPQQVGRPPARRSPSAPTTRSRSRRTTGRSTGCDRPARPRHPGRAGGGALVALALALGGLLLSVASAVRDERRRAASTSRPRAWPRRELRTEPRGCGGAAGGLGLIAAGAAGRARCCPRLAADPRPGGRRRGAPAAPLPRAARRVGPPLLGASRWFGLLAGPDRRAHPRGFTPLPRRPTGVAP